MRYSAFATVSGTREYTLSTLSIDSGANQLAMWDRKSFVWQPATDEAVPLTELDYKRWRRNQRLGASGSLVNDIPSRIVIKPSNDIVFEPTPNGTGPVTADYWKEPQGMAANADTPPYAARHHRIVTVRAKMMYAEYEDAPEIYQSAEKEYKDYLERLKGAELPSAEWKSKHESDRDLVVRVDGGDDDMGYHGEY